MKPMSEEMNKDVQENPETEETTQDTEEIKDVEKETEKAVEEAAERGWSLTDEAAAKCEGWYYKKDKNNSKRTYEYLKSKGY